MADPKAQSWSLEVVRGTNVGRRFALERGETVLGNAPNGAPSINLADQEGNAPRRMAGRQAKIELRNGNPVVADLESPGGTFVNRQRVLPGKGQPLEPDDVIQLGGVQLRVVTASQPIPKAPAPADPNRPFVLVLSFGSTCRNWDDFLAVSAQKWEELRQELVSGRLAGMLASQGLSAYVPDPNAPGTPDNRLDAWLGALPTTKSAAPELAVHPKNLSLRASAAGSTTERDVTITNTGYRMLTGSIGVEPADATWVEVEPIGRFSVVEKLRLRVRITTPAVVTETMNAAIVIDSNGGAVRVAISLERPGAATDPFPTARPGAARSGRGLIDWLESISPTKRLVFGGLGCAGVGLFLLVVEQVWPGAGGGEKPGMVLPSVVLGILGAAGGGAVARRRGTPGDVPAGIGSGAVAGVMAAALVVAIGRVIVGITGDGFGSVVGWGVVGTALAALSTVLVPHRVAEESKA